MPLILLLPHTSIDLPHALADFDCYRLPPLAENTNSLESVQNMLAALPVRPNYIAGSTSSPGLIWLIALTRWPEIPCLLQDNTKNINCWLELRNGEYWPCAKKQASVLSEKIQRPASVPTPDSPGNPVITSHNVSRQTLAESKLQKSGNSHGNTEFSDDKLLFEIFKHAAWGEEQAENGSQIKLLMLDASKRHRRNNSLLGEAKKVRELGCHAFNLDKEMHTRLKASGNTPEFQVWFNLQLGEEHKRVATHLRKSLEKWQDRQQQQKARRLQPVQSCTLPPLVLDNKPHPNSLRHLAPHTHWQILIDETGSEFDRPESLSIRARDLGRLVALALPVGVHGLAALKPNFHSCNELAEAVDEAIGRLLQAPVGIVGLTVKDQLAGGSPRWFTSIYYLMHLVMRLLPLHKNQPALVEFIIEQRGAMAANTDLFAIQQLLEAELHSLDQNRFGQVTISARITGKNGHPANGYVDAIAYTWSGSHETSKKRLKNAKLLGHCLLEPSHTVIERTYATLDGKGSLSPADWYTLTAVLGNEPLHSLAHSLLAQLGAEIQSNAGAWNEYLDEVRLRLTTKQYRLADIAGTISWLAQWQPANTHLPPRMRLHWHAARLACTNHLGNADWSAVNECLTLGKQLMDEAAPDVCQAHLRVAVSATNSFEFEIAQQVLSTWQDQPIAVCGLLNRAKVLSSQGQCSAFLGNTGEALGYFAEAIKLFERLSDTSESAREIAQTKVYQLIALMDHSDTTAEQITVALQNYFAKPLGKISGLMKLQEDRERYNHYLLLRALILYPTLRTVCHSYIDIKNDWLQGDSHPWPLINAYRAWWLHNCGDTKGASDYMSSAISLCRATHSGLTLQWMGEVLATVAGRLGIIAPLASAEQIEELRIQLPHAPWQSLTRLQNCQQSDTPAILSAFGTCLPFNFH